jgi:16S rRNA (guanine966-N2)-methyltransferase
LVAPDGRQTRPTSDRVREAIFNSLQSLGAIKGATVLDLFAGSGALGIEALSRGAERCTFVESSHDAVRALRDNLAATGLAGRAEVVVADAVEWTSRTQPSADLVLADPPYAFDGWDALLGALDADVVALESDRPIDLPARFDAYRTRRHGGTVVTLGRRASPADPQP